jgi:Tfp pilus assembly protein PilO
MDKGLLALLIVILALSIPVSAIVLSGMVKLRRLRMEEDKLRMDAAAATNSDQLATEVAQLRRELDEVHERLDFTERLLTQTKDQARLKEPDRPAP